MKLCTFQKKTILFLYLLSNFWNMKKFLALYGASAELLEQWKDMSQEDGEKEMAEWMKWMETHESALIDAGNPVGKNMRINNNGASDVSNEICGYTILQAESHEDASKMLSSNPHVVPQWAYIELMEITEM